MVNFDECGGGGDIEQSLHAGLNISFHFQHRHFFEIIEVASINERFHQLRFVLAVLKM